ncbi:MAG: class I SAM-dependent methyltransferase [Deltaproteobacteria bacterium]|jgi:SAM-dependent methyltransferase|nr:class I SAM-dependent methyltransferase [Deltaproteobacteria bacterium]
MAGKLGKFRKSSSDQAKGFEGGSLGLAAREHLDRVLGLMGLSPSDSVLDIASGTGACGRAAARLVRSVVCLDLDSAKLDAGRKLAAGSGAANVSFVKDQVWDMPFADGAFDAVICRLSHKPFQLLGWPAGPLPEIDRVLKGGGKLAIIDTDAASGRSRYVRDGIEAIQDQSHARYLRRTDLVWLFVERGYALERLDADDVTVPLGDWLAFAGAPPEPGRAVEAMMRDGVDGCVPPGLSPRESGGEISFTQSWITLICTKPGSGKPEGDAK